jgi:hypothetical protein
MIALQARSPQLPDPSRRTAQFVNMMNMSRQAEAAQLQGARTRQEMDYAKAAEGRAVETQASTQKKAELEYVGLATKQFSEDVAKLKEGDVAGAEAARADIVARIPAWNNYIRPASEWTPEYVTQLMSKASEIVAQTNPPAESTIEYSAKGARDAQGRLLPEGTPIQVVTGRRPSATPILAAGGTATPPPTAPTAPPASPVPTGKFGETRVAPDGGQLDEFQQDHVRRMKEGLGMTNTPASFTGGGMGAGQMTPEVMSSIVDSAFQTGVMAQVDFDQLLATQPPENRQAFTDAFRRANVTLQADAPSLADSAMGQQQMAANPVQTPQAGFAVMRGPAPQSQTAGLRGDMSMMRNTEAQYIPVQRRDPNVSPYPGSAQVPIERVRQEAVAGRETAGEVYAKEKARAKAQREALLEAGPKPLTVPQEAKLRDNITKDYTSAQSTIDAMLDPKSGVVAAVNAVRRLSQSQKEAVLGYTGYLPTVFPSTRQADTALKNLEGKVTALGKGEASLNGAIGQMAVQEWRIVRDLIASLDYTNMEPADLDRQLDIIEATAMRAAAMAENAYTNQYVEEFARYPGRFQLKKPGGTPTQSAPKAEAQIPRIRGNADYTKLKPGTLFIDPNGERRRKPK